LSNNRLKVLDVAAFASAVQYEYTQIITNCTWWCYEDMERGCAKRLPSTLFEQGGCYGSW